MMRRWLVWNCWSLCGVGVELGLGGMGGRTDGCIARERERGGGKVK